MSDVTTVVTGLLASLAVSWIVKYLGDDEIERQSFERRLRRK